MSEEDEIAEPEIRYRNEGQDAEVDKDVDRLTKSEMVQPTNHES